MTTPSAWTTGRRPGLPGEALMLYAVDVDTEDFARFDAWYTHEHLPERVGVPGFLRGRRYVRLSGPGQEHLTLYDARDAAVFSSAEYLARLEDPTPLTRTVMARFRRPHRAVLRVLFSQGAATGRELAVLHLPAARVSALSAWLRSALAPDVLADPSVCGLHLAVVDTEATAAKSATAEARTAAEEVDESCVLFIDGVRDLSVVADRAAELCRGAGLADDGVEPSVYEQVVSILPG